MIVLDTAPLLYWSLDPIQLTPIAHSKITDANKIIISSISIWEIGIKVKKGKLTIPMPIQAYTDTLKNVEKIEIYAVNEQVWIKNLALKWKHGDPADRTIVATATILDCPLLSPDREIQKFYRDTIW